MRIKRFITRNAVAASILSLGLLAFAVKTDNISYAMTMNQVSYESDDDGIELPFVPYNPDDNTESTGGGVTGGNNSDETDLIGPEDNTQPVTETTEADGTVIQPTTQTVTENIIVPEDDFDGETVIIGPDGEQFTPDGRPINDQGASIDVNADGNLIRINGDGTIIILDDTNGFEKTTDEQGNVIIVDKDGNIISLGDDGKLIKEEGENSKNEKTSSRKVIVIVLITVVAIIAIVLIALYFVTSNNSKKKTTKKK